MPDIDKESLLIKQEVRKDLIKEMSPHLTVVQMDALLQSFDSVASRYKFSRKSNSNIVDFML